MCVANGLNCTVPGPDFNGTGSCDCTTFSDCGTCRQDPGCAWCQGGASGAPKCINKGTEPTCILATSCEFYCNNISQSCATCIPQPGCAWCGDKNKCVDGRTPSCMVTHTCPNCDHRYCDPCVDSFGCAWCANTQICSALPVGSGCTINNQCESYCQGYSGCGSCNQVPGCGWCDSQNVCVDVDKSSCAVVHICGTTPIPPAPTCGFDGGAFVGGMFLVIGVIVLIVLAVIFYRWKTGKKILYTELR